MNDQTPDTADGPAGETPQESKRSPEPTEPSNTPVSSSSVAIEPELVSGASSSAHAGLAASPPRRLSGDAQHDEPRSGETASSGPEVSVQSSLDRLAASDPADAPDIADEITAVLAARLDPQTSREAQASADPEGSDEGQR